MKLMIGQTFDRRGPLVSKEVLETQFHFDTILTFLKFGDEMDQFIAVLHSDLLEKIVDMVFHRMVGNKQSLLYFLIRLPIQNQTQDILLSFRDAVFFEKGIKNLPVFDNDKHTIGILAEKEFDP